MSTVTSVTIVDAYVSDLVADLVTSMPVLSNNQSDIERYIGAFPHRTARTNVMLRGADGRFISYRKVSPKYVGDAVEALKPFPTDA